MCLPHIMVFFYIFVVYISFECVCVYIYNFWEFCFINLRIVNYFVGFDRYAPAMRCYIRKYIYIYIYIWY